MLVKNVTYQMFILCFLMNFIQMQKKSIIGCNNSDQISVVSPMLPEIAEITHLENTI